MKRRHYTREIQAELARGGRVAVNSVGPMTVVRYEPRSKRDPQPWTNGTFRYSGREVHTVPENYELTKAAQHGETLKLHRELCASNPGFLVDPFTWIRRGNGQVPAVTW
jgi:hypothetical protein